MKSVVKLIKQFLLVISIMNFSFIYAQEINKEVSVEEYVSSLDKYDYQKYIERSDKNFLIRDIGNTGAFLSEIVNMGNRKYSFAYVVYILPDQKNEVIRDLSKRTVYSFEKWKIWEKENEIKRRENEYSLIETLTELHPKLIQVYEKYIDKIISNNRKLMLGYFLGLIESEIFDINRNNVKEWETSDYKILPNDDFIKFIDNPQHIEPKSGSEGVYYVLQVNVVRGEKTIINLPFYIYNINDDWSYLNFQISSKPFELDISNKESLLEKVKLINKIKDDYKIIEVSYNNLTNSGLRNHLKKLQKSFDKLSSEFNELVSSEFNYFDFGSSNEVWYPSDYAIFRGSGLFETVDELKQIAENNKIEVLDFNFNPTKEGRLNYSRLNFNYRMPVLIDVLKNRLKNELKPYVENEQVLDNVVDKCSIYMIGNYLKYKTDNKNYSGSKPYTDSRINDFLSRLGYNIGKHSEDFKFFERIEIIKSKKSYLHFLVENSYEKSYGASTMNWVMKYKEDEDGKKRNVGRFYLNEFSWKIDFEKMKLEHYSQPNSMSNYKPLKTLLTSIDLN